MNIRAIGKKELPGWINTRAKQKNIMLERDSILLLSELTEGNLLATQQALEKIQLLYPKETITPDKVMQAISDSARFHVFDFANLWLSGDTKAALRCLHGLKETGTEATLALWAICRELRELIKIADEHRQGTPLQQVLQRQWQSRRAPTATGTAATSF